MFSPEVKLMFSTKLFDVLCPFHSAPKKLRVQIDVNPQCSHCKADLLLDGRYALRGLLGEGGFGRVYWAIDIANNFREVTVKQAIYRGERLRDTELGAEVLSQLMCESQLLKKLAHRQIPKLLGLFSEKDEVFLVEEYMTGESLSQLAEKNDGIDSTEAREVLEHIVPVLLYLHHGFIRPIAHNDISPKNIITPSVEREEHALIDLGSARQIGPRVEYGSYHPAYAAPEVLASFAISSGSDQYSLGATVISAMGGGSLPRTPDRAYDHWQASLQELARRSQDPTLVGVLRKMTQRYPEDRFNDLREVLDNLSAGRPVVSSSAILAGRAGYERIHDIKLTPFGKRCRDFQSSVDMGTLALISGEYTLHVIDVNSSRSVLSFDIGVPFSYRISRDGRWVAVQLHQQPALHGVSLPKGGIFVAEVKTGKVTVLLDGSALSPAILAEVQKTNLSDAGALLFSSQSLLLALQTGLVMSWRCSSWEQAGTYRKERGSGMKFKALVPAADGYFLAGESSSFTLFREGDPKPQGEFVLPSRSRNQGVLPWDGLNTWVSHSADLVGGGKHRISIEACDLLDSLPPACTQAIREIEVSPVAALDVCEKLGYVAVAGVGERFVRIYNQDLEQVDVISTSSVPTRVIFSPRGNYLFVCGGEAVSVFHRS